MSELLIRVTMIRERAICSLPSNVFSPNGLIYLPYYFLELLLLTRCFYILIIKWALRVARITSDWISVMSLFMFSRGLEVRYRTVLRTTEYWVFGSRKLGSQHFFIRKYPVPGKVDMNHHQFDSKIATMINTPYWTSRPFLYASSYRYQLTTARKKSLEEHWSHSKGRRVSLASKEKPRKTCDIRPLNFPSISCKNNVFSRPQSESTAWCQGFSIRALCFVKIPRWGRATNFTASSLLHFWIVLMLHYLILFPSFFS